MQLLSPSPSITCSHKALLVAREPLPSSQFHSFGHSPGPESASKSDICWFETMLLTRFFWWPTRSHAELCCNLLNSAYSFQLTSSLPDFLKQLSEAEHLWPDRPEHSQTVWILNLTTDHHKELLEQEKVKVALHLAKPTNQTSEHFIMH